MIANSVNVDKETVRKMFHDKLNTYEKCLWKNSVEISDSRSRVGSKESFVLAS